MTKRPHYDVAVYSHGGTSFAYKSRFKSLLEATASFHHHASAGLYDLDCSVELTRAVGLFDGVTLASKAPDQIFVTFNQMFYAEGMQ